ncbi:MAG: methyltransferase [Okeania sp. SIO2C2]|uniref:methyltransferase n=1 Tax=Okeania sp. SIO2C2 TaxID=2607787 RepID=UPI0013B657E7|nr:methyltransferase [Okeania sp. SIO2C2]NEP85516.1 methyltransferase [Okeania sp. SIO2C2]
MIRQEDVRIILKEGEALKYDRKDYLKFHEELSSKDRETTILFQEEPIFDALVPQGVFNPYGGIAAQAFMSGILNEIVNAKGKRVLDLGCGCGVIGLCCLFKESAKVVFSDLHPNIMPLKNNPLIREQDEVKVQDLCVEEKDNSYDLAFMSFPSRSIDRLMEADSYEIGILRNDDLVFRAIEQVGRVLAPGGEFVFFYRIFNNSFPLYLEVMSKLAAHFDLTTLKLLWYAGENDGHG